jgi:hypothetical protein
MGRFSSASLRFHSPRRSMDAIISPSFFRAARRPARQEKQERLPNRDHIDPDAIIQ